MEHASPVSVIVRFATIGLSGLVFCGCANEISVKSGAGLSVACESFVDNDLGVIDPVLSPDGEYIAYRAMTTDGPHVGEFRLSRFREGSVPLVLLKHGEFYGGASWSPDGKWISYTVSENIDDENVDDRVRLVAKSIYKVNIHTGQKTRLVDGRRLPSVGEYTAWTTGNEILFATSDTIYSISPDGGMPERRIIFDTPFLDAPQHLVAAPGHNAVVFSIEGDYGHDVPESAGIWVADIDSNQLTQLTFGELDYFPVWRDELSILFMRLSHGLERPFLRMIDIQNRTQVPVSSHGIFFSMAYSQYNDVMALVTADRLDSSGNDLNFFRGFSISKCRLLESEH